MKAELLIRERRVLEGGFIEVIVWGLPEPLSGSTHGSSIGSPTSSRASACCATTTSPAKATTGTRAAR